MEESIGVTQAVTSPGQIPAMRFPGAPVPKAQRHDGRMSAALPPRSAAEMAEAAVRYAEERHWDVVPGTCLEIIDGVQRCSCGRQNCPAPGAHPTTRDWPAQATGSANTVRRLWAERPGSSVLLPTGRTFDVLDVPESAGFLALARIERMGLSLGPVLNTPIGRTQFFVLPGAGARLSAPERPRAPRPGRPAGPGPGSGPFVLGEGGWVAAPPTRIGGRGLVQWVLPPTAANAWLPDAEQIAPTLRYACIG